MNSEIMLGLLIVAVLALYKGIIVVPAEQVWVIEKFSKYSRIAKGGLKLIIPFVERVAYKHNISIEWIDIEPIELTFDGGSSIYIDGKIELQITDPKMASYNVHDPYAEVMKLIKHEIGLLSSGESLDELNEVASYIANKINKKSSSWGISCNDIKIKQLISLNKINNLKENKHANIA